MTISAPKMQEAVGQHQPADLTFGRLRRDENLQRIGVQDYGIDEKQGRRDKIAERMHSGLGESRRRGIGHCREIARDLAQSEEGRGQKSGRRPDMGIGFFGHLNAEQIGEAGEDGGNAAAEKQKRKARETNRESQSDAEKPERSACSTPDERSDQDHSSQGGKEGEDVGCKSAFPPDQREGDRGRPKSASLTDDVAQRPRFAEQTCRQRCARGRKQRQEEVVFPFAEPACPGDRQIGLQR